MVDFSTESIICWRYLHKITISLFLEMFISISMYGRYNRLKIELKTQMYILSFVEGLLLVS